LLGQLLLAVGDYHRPALLRYVGRQLTNGVLPRRFILARGDQHPDLFLSGLDSLEERLPGPLLRDPLLRVNPGPLLAACGDEETHGLFLLETT
jgi:hypothetical protein